MAATPPEFTAGYYERQYESRRWRARGDRPLLFNSIRRDLRRRASGRLLDVGCGEGHLLRRLARDFDASGIDVSEEGIRLARRNAPLSDLRVASATSIPFPEDHFDVLVCIDVVEHLTSPEDFLREAHRVLREHGLLLISTPNPCSFGARRKGSRSFIHRDATHISVHPPEMWRGLIQKTCFQLIRDGTDGLWDPPYFARLPIGLQRAAFLGSAYCLWAFTWALGWPYGENYLALARKSLGGKPDSVTSGVYF